MSDYGPETYGERIAEVYDELYAERFGEQAEEIATALAGLARGGRALELGIGTGRIALPLQARGIEVQGIDSSAQMATKLRAKPGGERIPVTIGDFADMGVEGEFSVVFVVFNTFFGLLSQEEQVRCFRNVSKHLAADGVFVIEAFVPDQTRHVRGQSTSVTRVEADSVGLDVSRHDPVSQRVTSQHLLISESGVRLYPVQLRYAWPAELDLMAQLVGLRLRERWGGWKGERFTATSGSHVSIYERG